MDLHARIETRAERERNERCTSSQLFAPLSSCRGGLRPALGLQFGLRSSGTLFDQLHLDVDYDTERELAGSNVLSLAWRGDSGARVERIELGSLSFAMPASRFITAAVPAGNYGLQAAVRLGRFQVRAIAAQQKGSVVQSRHYTVGDTSAAQNGEREIDDHQVEARRFFFVVDPALLDGYPNVDLLDAGRLARARALLPDTLRPVRVQLYRLRAGTPPADPSGPRFRVLGASSGMNGAARQTYDVLREGVDYVVDPSLLWVALARPLDASAERLVVAYAVAVAGRDTVWLTTGGTPDLHATGGDQVASLLWDPTVTPDDAAFRREIRSVYRLGGPELKRETLRLRIVTGAADQERPLVASSGGDTYDTWLAMLGLSQANNGNRLDAEGRVWPRRGDPVLNLASAADAASSPAIADQFLVFPSLRPFARRDSGLVIPGNPSNAAIYSAPGEYLGSPQHPPTVFRLRFSYEASTLGGSGGATIALGSLQLRRGSEHVEVGGRRLVRDLDYRIDYDLGRITFLGADTLFATVHDVSVSYEETPLFESSPTSLYGLVGELPLPHGSIAVTAISQSQRTAFTRPTLGFEPAAALMGGATARFEWNAPALTRALGWLPAGPSTASSRITLFGEVAASRPREAGSSEAYLESFEGDGAGGITLPLADPSWSLASMPAVGSTLAVRFGSGFFTPDHASTLAWQNNAAAQDGTPVLFRPSDIDSLGTIAGIGRDAPEPLLWLTLYPLGIGGRLDPATHRFGWHISGAPAGSRRFRSIRTVLSPSGVDLTRVEQLEFWTLVDTSAAGRGRNPTLVFDVGQISENTLAIAPETLVVRPGATGADSLFGGKRTQGFDVMNSERDPFSRAFDVGRNDVGLPGDLLDSLLVIDSTRPAPQPEMRTGVPLCTAVPGSLHLLGDTRTNCTRGNWRLDEDDIDLDGTLSLPEAEREQEKIVRYVIDLADSTRWARLGREAQVTDTVAGVAVRRSLRWVLVRVPFGAPDDSLGQVTLRRARALRLTIISGAAATDSEFTQIPLARLRLVGPPWVKRSAGTLAGVAGEMPHGGWMAASLIGTADRDSLAGLDYESPPGVREVAASSAQLRGGTVQLNERSLRIVTTALTAGDRAEAYYRFPAGDRSFLRYRELRLWARGRGPGWGSSGELAAFVRIGRDADNFYLYRTPVNAGAGQGAWLPEVRVALDRFAQLRGRIQRAYLAGADSLVDCPAADSALVAASPAPASGHRYVACDGGYMVYSADPAVAPPNLAAVQELGVGIVRLTTGGVSTIGPADSLELWVDDIRLARPTDDVGSAAQAGVEIVASDVAQLRIGWSRRDARFRQMAETPSFVGERALELSATVRLDKFLPNALGLAMPLTVTRSSVAGDPLYLTGTDLPASAVAALRAPRVATTTYNLSVRRATPLDNPVLGPLVNHLVATSTYTDGADRGEYHDGGAHRFAVGLDYVVADSARRVGLLRWNPARFRLTSRLERGGDRNFSFLQPVATPGDDPRVAVGITDLWRNGASLELQPMAGVTMRWDASSVRDLRQYGDTNLAATLAGAARGRMFGADAGLERERGMQTNIVIAPAGLPWLSPRLEWTSSYGMLRDPNLVADSTLSDIPRRLSASRTATASGRVLPPTCHPERSEGSTVPAPWLAALCAALPLDLSVTRTLLTAYDGALFGPRLGLQLGFADAGGFRMASGSPAANAGATTTLAASHSVHLPLGVVLVNRFRRSGTESWTRRPEGDQARLDGLQTVFPDVSLRWNWRPSGVSSPLAGLAATAGFARASSATSLPTAIITEAPPFRTTTLRTMPFTLSLALPGGGPSAAAGFTRTLRADSLPGSVTRGATNDVNVDLGQTVPLPRFLRVGTATELRTRATWQWSRSHGTVNDLAQGLSSRVLDLGRSAFSLNADTDLSDAVMFTLQATRAITFDHTQNRRISQLVLSTGFELQLSRH